jgi:CheY-like chemotaxis protein
MKLIIDGNIDAAQTIISCAQHQKSIVDDILTLSKLDSDLLSITPIAVDPKKIIQEALKIFATESRRAEIKLSWAVDKSVDDFKIDWVLLDPSRLLQVLINLLTNALKFTQTGRKRDVTVTMSAHTERPSCNKSSIISYIPTRSLREDIFPLSAPPETSKQPYFLHFAVKDTGRGLTDGEKKLLFKRFSQASPRTHVQYGGSGLGLFISRKLTELQGGEIGVASEGGVGSTFAFYVRTQMTSPPDDVVTTPKVSIQKAFKDSSRLTATVLVVEDNLINQAVLSKQLRNLGSTVHVANHGGEALDFLRTTKYWKNDGGKGMDLSIILLDIEMPVMDGLTCARKIRELQREGDIIGHIPIIAVSANARSEQIMTAKAAGMVC